MVLVLTLTLRGDLGLRLGDPLLLVVLQRCFRIAVASSSGRAFGQYMGSSYEYSAVLSMLL